MVGRIKKKNAPIDMLMLRGKEFWSVSPILAQWFQNKSSWELYVRVVPTQMDKTCQNAEPRMPGRKNSRPFRFQKERVEVGYVNPVRPDLTTMLFYKETDKMSSLIIYMY